MSKKYSSETLNKALKDVEDGVMSIYKASKEYKIPNQTLYDKVHKKYSKNESVGAPTTLTADEEGHIVKWILHMADMGFPVSKDMLLHSVKSLVTELDRPTKFKNGIPGRHWFESFMRRHPSITKRVSQTLTLSRASINENMLRDWFQRVEAYFLENNLTDVLSDPSRIFNCDETAFFMCPKGQACLAKKGARTVYSKSGNDEKECLTLLLGASADGKLMPPMALFPYKRIPSSILSAYPKSWSIGRSDSGWMTCEGFFEYITNVFNPFLIKQNIKKPVVLFLDGHVSHLSLHLSEFCKNNDIVLVALPPNSTHLMQPMDVAVFKPLKTSWRKNVYQWRMENNASRLKRHNFAPLLETSIASSLTTDIIKNGFRKTGLYPFTPNSINYETLFTKAASTVTSISPSVASTPNSAKSAELNSINSNNTNSFIEIFENLLGVEKLQAFHQSGDVWEGDINDTNLYLFWKNARNEIYQSAPQCSANISMCFGDSTLKANECTLSNIILDWPENISEMEMIIENDGQLVAAVNTGNESNSNSKQIPFDDLVDNVLEEKSTNAKSEFPTPFKNALLWPETPSNNRKKCVRKKLTPTVASSHEFIEYQRRLLNEKQENINKIEERKKMRELKKSEKINKSKIKTAASKIDIKDINAKQDASISTGAFVIVLYEAEKFPGQVIRVCDNKTYEIKTMTMSTVSNGRCTWRWPKQDDILMYGAEEIIKVIDPPVPLNKRGVFSVEM